jgi:hypothetical protein
MIEYWRYGCDKMSLYRLALQPVNQTSSDTEVIRYQNLSRNEQRLVRKALETGRYQICGTSDELTANESDAWRSLGKKVRALDDRAYLRHEDQYFRIGIARGDIIYGGEDVLIETPEPPQTEPDSGRT